MSTLRLQCCPRTAVIACKRLAGALCQAVDLLSRVTAEVVANAQALDLRCQQCLTGGIGMAECYSRTRLKPTLAHDTDCKPV